MKYSELTEERREHLRAYQRNWYKNNPERVKKFKKSSVLKRFQPTVYAYFDPEGNPLYVGKSNYPITRNRTHEKESSWWNENLILVTMTCKDEWEAIEYEGKWGGTYRPEHNIEGQRKEKYWFYTGVE